MLTLDKLAREVAVEVGDRNLERLKEIKRYVGRVVNELTMMLRKGSVYQTTTLNIVNNIADLPDDVAAVLKVYDGSGVFYESVDNDEFRLRSTTSSTAHIPTVRILENIPNWTAEFINVTDTSTAIKMDYLIASEDPGVLPDYYRDLIVEGTKKKYHQNRSTSEKYQIAAEEYKKLVNMFSEIQSRNDARIVRMKSDYELDLQDSNNLNSRLQANDFFSIGLGGHW